MSTQYSDDLNIQKEVAAIVERFPNLRRNMAGIHYGVCFSIRTDKEGNIIPCLDDPVKIKKVPADMNLFFKQPLDVLLLVDYGFWEGASDKEKAGYVHRALSRVMVSKGLDGTKKIKFRKWDIQENLVTLTEVGEYTEMHRAWSETVRRMVSGTQAVLNSLREKAPLESESSATDLVEMNSGVLAGSEASEEVRSEEEEHVEETPKTVKRRARPSKKEKEREKEFAPSESEASESSTEEDYPGIRINSDNDDELTPLDVGGLDEGTPLEDESNVRVEEVEAPPQNLKRPAFARVSKG